MIAPEHVADAIERITEIHGHIAKGEVYRGYRPLPVAATGIVGIAAALVQPAVVGRDDLRSFVLFWIAVAGLNMALHAATILQGYLRESEFARRRARRVLGQFVPSIAAGAILTAGIAHAADPALRVLPGVWALVFSLALFSSRPYLPRRTGWVALYYLIAGGLLLMESSDSLTHLGWGMGVTFGLGQLAGAAVLKRDEERHG